MKVNPPVNRLRGSAPKVGIRPIIDGRYGGVRESLEGQVMAMARATADLISRELRHPSGRPGAGVIAGLPAGCRWSACSRTHASAASLRRHGAPRSARARAWGSP